MHPIIKKLTIKEQERSQQYWLRKFSFWSSLLTLAALIYDLGFLQGEISEHPLRWFYSLVLVLGIFSTVVWSSKQPEKKSIWRAPWFNVFSVLFFIIMLLRLNFLDSFEFLQFFVRKAWLASALLLLFIQEFSLQKFNFKRSLLNPAQLFVVSFLLVVFAGAFLLKLPNSTTNPITFVDALFTSTSAVCVTGLSVVDTGTRFTPLGQTILIFLMEVGGLGILTFVSYFGYFFTGSTSYENQLVLSDMNNTQQLSEVFNTIKKVLLVTFIIEFVGGVIIFISLANAPIDSLSDKIFFSLFHCVSAFCNAGFSTLPNNLYEEAYRHNYLLKLTIAGLFILGGLGFPVVFNIYKYTKYRITNWFSVLANREKPTYVPWVIDLGTRIMGITAIALLLIGTLGFYILERTNTLAEHGEFGKWASAFFNAATPRTAGFNDVDMAILGVPTVLLIIMLMWVGASPASTGGGIKTSTFAIAILNFFSLAKGKDRIEIYRREVADITVRRAFAMISLSLVVIGFGSFSISMFDTDKPTLSIVFECFSAFSTVGLSLGITGKLTDVSKLIIVALMFIGRVGMLSILIAFMRQFKYKNYRYPTEEILLN